MTERDINIICGVIVASHLTVCDKERLCALVRSSIPSALPASASPGSAEEDFWKAVALGWDIEPRTYFEKEAIAMGFKSPIEMAVHHMWKRHAKVWPNAELSALPASEGQEPPAQTSDEETP